MECIHNFIQNKIRTLVSNLQHIKEGLRKQSLTVIKVIAMKTIILFLFSSGLVSAALNRTIRGLPKIEDCGKIRDNPYTGGTHYLCDFHILGFPLHNFATLSLVFLLISNLTSWLRLHQFLGTCLPQ